MVGLNIQPPQKLRDTFNIFGIEDNFPFCKTAQLTYKEEEKIRKMACAQRKNEGTFF